MRSLYIRSRNREMSEVRPGVSTGLTLNSVFISPLLKLDLGMKELSMNKKSQTPVAENVHMAKPSNKSSV